MQRILRITLILLIVAMLAATLSAPFAHAFFDRTMRYSPPWYSQAWYISADTPGEFYNMGFADGQFDMTYQCNASYTKDALVILDFGGVVTGHGTGSYGGYATRLFGGSYEPLQNVVGAADSYAQGWYAATTTCVRLNLSIGTNNSTSCGTSTSCSQQAGIQWSNAVNSINSWLTAQSYSWQILAGGADDIESWGTAAAARAFVDGFNSVPNGYLVNFGSADGCPTSGTGACSNWSQADYQYVSWAGRAWPIPEIYLSDGVQASQWANIKLHYPMTFLGAMSETAAAGDPIPSWGSPLCGSTNCDTEAYNQLSSALTSRDIGQNIDFLLNIRWK